MNSITEPRAMMGLSTAQRTAGQVALVGAFVYAAVAFNLLFAPDYPQFGKDIYDQYYFSILEGRLDLPATVVRYEGHYLADGTAYLYHGLAPLLTRFALGWFWPFETISLASFSILFWAVSGTALLHKMLHDLTVKAIPSAASEGGWSMWLSFLVWFGTPGLLIVSNSSVYHEPYAVAFFASMAFIHAFIRHRFFGAGIKSTFIIMAICAAVALHARPNVAIGLYAGLCFFITAEVFLRFRTAILPVVVAMTILGLSGAGYLAINKLKFGNAATVHGSFSSSEAVYGSVFWGWEKADSDRAKAFIEHGKFNAGRIVPNLAFYMFEPPENFGAYLSKKAGDLFRYVTEESFGFIRREPPRAGMLFLWLPWFALLGWVARTKKAVRQLGMGWPIVSGMAISALTTLSYGTIAFRYRFDIWPFMVSLLVFCWPLIAGRAISVFDSSKRTLALSIFIVGLLVTISMSIRCQALFIEEPGTFFMSWPQDLCEQLAVLKGFSHEAMVRICAK